MSSIVVLTVQSPCQADEEADAECWVDCSGLVVQRHKNFDNGTRGENVAEIADPVHSLNGRLSGLDMS